MSFSPDEFFAAIEADVIEPLRSVQSLIDAAPYTTRLSTTISAEEMTVDPVFELNEELPDVSHLHQTDRVLECSSDILEHEAFWRIDFPQGTTLRGVPSTAGSWPAALDEQPANIRVLELTDTGAGEVVTDNSGLIGEMLGDYNASLPVRRTPEEREQATSRNSCSLSSRGAGGTPVPVVLGFAALLGASWLRRKAKPPGSGTTWRSPVR